MAINIDPARAIRGPADQWRLIEAVRDALAADEANWIEWKSTLPLSERAGRFIMAKNILGMANRHPEESARFCDGLGYVIIGAQPGEISGVEQIDPAKLDDGLRAYLGPNGPEWSPNLVAMAEMKVLILTVEAPRWGDPIYLLRKSYQPETGKGADNGAIFVRRKGSTTIADAGEIDMLQDRARRRPDADLSVSLDWLGQPLILTPIDQSRLSQEMWIQSERDRLLEPLCRHQEAKRRGRVTNPMVAFSDQYSQLIAAAILPPNLDFQKEKRTPEAYTREVEDYLAKCARELMAASFSALVKRGTNRLRLSLNNPTVRNLPDVALTLSLPGPIMAFDEVPDYGLPEPPRPFGTPRPSPNLFNPGLAHPGWMRSEALQRPPRVAVEIRQGDPATIRLRAGNLRPLQSAELAEFHIVVLPRPEHEVLATWEATSTGVDAVAHGEFRFSIADGELTPLDLLPPEARGQEGDS